MRKTRATRRDFMRGAGAAASARAFGANDQIGLGFIGVGIRGTILLEGFKAIAGVRPVAAADVYDGRVVSAKELTDGAIAGTRDYTEVLQRKDVDAVVIATPDHWHHRMVLDALAAGKHVYIEKPMTWSIAQGQDIIAAVQRSGKLLMVGSGAKTSAATAKARELVKRGALGQVNMVRMANNRNSPEGAWVYPIPPGASEKTIDWKRFLGPAPQRAFDPRIVFRWRCWWEYSGGVATDLFVHLLSSLHEFMDVAAPRSVVSQGGIYRWKDGRTVPDVMNSIYEYGEGFLADMYVNLGNSRESHGTVIMGTEATLLMERAKLVLYREPTPSPIQRYGSIGWPKALRARYFEAHGFTAEGRSKGAPRAPKQPEEIAVERGVPHHEYFIRSLRDGSPSKENAAEGHCAASAAHLANLAFLRGRRVEWDPKKGEVREA